MAVIGAGLASLAAAQRLVEDDISITIFERKCQPGGTWQGHTKLMTEICLYSYSGCLKPETR